MNKAVFLDRDGTLIVDRGYLDNCDDMELLPNVGSALQILLQAGFVLVLVTNQSGIGRGYFPRETVEAQHCCLQKLLQPYNVQLSAIYYCPHAPEKKCRCRKPQPGLLHDAAAQLEIDLPRSFMIGDKDTDVAAGLNAGCKAVHIGNGCEQADYQAPDLPAAVAWIVSHDE